MFACRGFRVHVFVCLRVSPVGDVPGEAVSGEAGREGRARLLCQEPEKEEGVGGARALGGR